MNAAIDLNGTFSERNPILARHVETRFMPIQPNSHGRLSRSATRWGQEACEVATAEASEVGEPTREPASDRAYAWVETVGFTLAVLVVIGLGTLGGWAVTLVFNSLMQAQSLMVQNSFVFHR